MSLISQPAGRLSLTALETAQLLLGINDNRYSDNSGFFTVAVTVNGESIAVLPFENQSHDPDKDYLSNKLERAIDIGRSSSSSSMSNLKSNAFSGQASGKSAKIVQVWGARLDKDTVSIFPRDEGKMRDLHVET